MLNEGKIRAINLTAAVDCVNLFTYFMNHKLMGQQFHSEKNVNFEKLQNT